MLTNVMLYWLTDTGGIVGATSTTRACTAANWPTPSVSADRGRRLRRKTSRSAVRASRATHITHWSEFDRGGHFAALEAPDLFVQDVRAFFRTVR